MVLKIDRVGEINREQRQKWQKARDRRSERIKNEADETIRSERKVMEWQKILNIHCGGINQDVDSSQWHEPRKICTVIKMINSSALPRGDFLSIQKSNKVP